MPTTRKPDSFTAAQALKRALTRGMRFDEVLGNLRAMREVRAVILETGDRFRDGGFDWLAGDFYKFGLLLGQDAYPEDPR
jgi:hypothetical protein